MDLSGCDSSEWSGSVDLSILFLPLFLPKMKFFWLPEILVDVQMISGVYGRMLKSDLSGCDSSEWKCSVDNCVLAIPFTFFSFFLLPLSSPHPTFLSPPFPSLQQGYVSSVLQSSSGERPSSGVSSMSSSLSSRGQSISQSLL